MFPTRLRLYNKAWVANRLELNVRYFERLAEGQSPQALWIGCCDSRAPAEEITGARPGELFVHRNIANIVRADDPSFAGVLFYALEVLKVPHVIVCGHSNCGGVRGALDNHPEPCLSQWLGPIRSLLTPGELTDPDKDAVCLELVKKNVRRAVNVLSEMAPVQARWKQASPLAIHGWVYHLDSGYLEALEERRSASESTAAATH
ncbi:MAG: carbonic anhydrase [Bdellovibrionales bacterium]|nr:carbonic anhydrase [Bdellovibrionales bacterium]